MNSQTQAVAAAVPLTAEAPLAVTWPDAPDPGHLPAWNVDDLPEAPKLTLRNVFHVIGPGAILLATSIGGGEWLVGPAAAVKYGVGLLGIASIAIVLQMILNTEAIRYTLWSGEPIVGGFLRLGPGAGFWAAFYTVLAFVHLAWPALALSSAGTAFSLLFGRLPGGPVDSSILSWMGSGVLLATSCVLLFGGTIERTLERVSWFMLGYIFLFLVVVNVVAVPFAHWGETLMGFVSLRPEGGRLDWALIAALAVGSGCGGLGNLTISNWFRDKGFGMGAKVGAIASAVGGRSTTLSPVGTVFPPTAENLRRFRRWWTYVQIDQIVVWAAFCFIGMFLTTNLATGIVPRGTDLQGLATGSYQAEHLAAIWRPLWYLTLLNGFWILYSTQLGNTDLLVRTVTDVLWMGSPRVRRWSRERVSRVYYAILAGVTAFGLLTIRTGGAFGLFKIITNVGGLLVVIAGVQILIVNHRFLPPGVRAPRWRQALLIATVVFYAFFLSRTLLDLFGATG